MAFLYVKIYHGPCNTFNNNIHKPQMVAGLRDRLQKLGFRVDLIPVDITNYCMLEMCGNEVFRCNITNLKFNTSSDRDAVCQKAVRAVIESSVKFRRARAYLWFWMLLDHELFLRGSQGPKDYWIADVDLEPFGTTSDCVKCCDNLLRQDKHDKK